MFNMKFETKSYCHTLLVIFSIFTVENATAQAGNKKNSNLVYMDKEGVLRYTSNKSEATFFGVNYTSPFAHAYRAHKAINSRSPNGIRVSVHLSLQRVAETSHLHAVAAQHSY